VAGLGLIHAAFNHDFSKLKQNSEDDRKVIEKLADDHHTSAEFPRATSEEAAHALITEGGRVVVMRLPQVRRRSAGWRSRMVKQGALQRGGRGRYCPARYCRGDRC
jgi:hypothetical protein